MRAGRFKLLRSADQAPWQLHELATDVGETHELAATQPARLHELVRRFEDWRAEVAADPTRSADLRR
jgi:arylsulfatase A-like enzyme